MALTGTNKAFAEQQKLCKGFLRQAQGTEQSLMLYPSMHAPFLTRIGDL